MQNALSAEIGQRLRTYRLLRGLTQEELAEKAGMHQTYIGQVERGEKNLTLTSLEKLTRSLQIPFSVLFDGLEEISDVSEDVALKCYKIVRDKDPVKQLHLYKILLEIDMIIVNDIDNFTLK